MIRQKAIDFLLKLLVALIVVRNICLFLSITNVASVLFYIVYLVATLIIGMALLVNGKRKLSVNLYVLGTVLLLLLLIIIPSTYGLSGWTLNGYTPISFFLTIVMMLVSRKLIVSDKTLNAIYRLFLVQAIFSIVCAFLPSSYDYGTLILGQGNPNQTSLVLWINFAFCFLYWQKNKRTKGTSFILWAIMISLSFLILLTESRTAMLPVIFCFTLLLVNRWKSSDVKIPKRVHRMIVISPILVPIIILGLLNFISTDFLILGKSLFSGREVIWRNIFEAFFESPFAFHLNESPYYRAVLINNESTLRAMGTHNGFLAMQWNYGIIVTLLVIQVIFNNYRDLRRAADNSREVHIIYIVALATMLTLCFEEGMLMGNFCATAVFPLLFIFGRSEEFYRWNTVRKN